MPTLTTPTREPLVELLRTRQWMATARCTGQTHIFFASDHERAPDRGRREATARQICQTCPVIDECRTYARTHHEYGVWGGETEEERAAAGYAPHPAATCTQIDTPLALHRALARSPAALSAAELAARIGVPRKSVWQHVEHLAQMGIVIKTLCRGEPGRPKHRYALTARNQIAVDPSTEVVAQTGRKS